MATAVRWGFGLTIAAALMVNAGCGDNEAVPGDGLGANQDDNATEQPIMTLPDVGTDDPARPDPMMPKQPGIQDGDDGLPDADRPESGSGEDEQIQMVERELQVSMEAPDTAWNINIDEVYLINNEQLVVVARLDRPEGMMGGQMITTVEDSVTVMAPADATVETYVLGKNWGWSNEGLGYNFVDSMDAVREKIAGAEKIYEFGAEGREGG